MFNLAGPCGGHSCARACSELAVCADKSVRATRTGDEVGGLQVPSPLLPVYWNQYFSDNPSQSLERQSLIGKVLSAWKLAANNRLVGEFLLQSIHN